MLANYSQHQRRSKMDLMFFILLFGIGAIVFVAIQLVAILFLLKENNRIGEELEKNSPPF
jgi:hypothetical protein